MATTQDSFEYNGVAFHNTDWLPPNGVMRYRDDIAIECGMISGSDLPIGQSKCRVDIIRCGQNAFDCIKNAVCGKEYHGKVHMHMFDADRGFVVDISAGAARLSKPAGCISVNYIELDIIHSGSYLIDVGHSVYWPNATPMDLHVWEAATPITIERIGDGRVRAISNVDLPWVLSGPQLLRLGYELDALRLSYQMALYAKGGMGRRGRAKR